jgi:diguanylate cyclase (GGDEF)-like protein
MKDYFKKYLTHTDRSRLQQSLFHVNIRNKSVHFFKIIIGIIGTIVLLGWPTDYLNFNEPEIFWSFFMWRAIFISCVLVFFLAVNLSTFFRNYIFHFIYFGTLLVIAATGYIFGNVDGITIRTPWFEVAYVIPFATVVISTRIYRRIWGTIIVPLIYSVSFLGFNTGPEAWGYKFIGMSLNLIVATVFLSVLLGHFIYHLNRSSFFQSRKGKIQRKKIHELAIHDQLTGLYNRREFENRLEEEFFRSKRYNDDLSILMLDLDHFKNINDTHGHPAGDEVLREIGDLIEEKTRKTDIPCRYGGEEFCIALVKSSISTAEDIAQRIRQKLSQRRFDHNGTSFSVTCSIGISQLQPDDENFSSLLERTDEALYDAKSRGRDCVVVRS